MFTVGQRVRAANPRPDRLVPVAKGAEGAVMSVEPDKPSPYEVMFDDGFNDCYTADELEPA